jgi:hypothetical protein
LASDYKSDCDKTQTSLPFQIQTYHNFLLNPTLRIFHQEHNSLDLTSVFICVHTCSLFTVLFINFVHNHIYWTEQLLAENFRFSSIIIGTFLCQTVICWYVHNIFCNIEFYVQVMIWTCESACICVQARVCACVFQPSWTIVSENM